MVTAVNISSGTHTYHAQRNGVVVAAKFSFGTITKRTFRNVDIRYVVTAMESLSGTHMYALGGSVQSVKK